MLKSCGWWWVVAYRILVSALVSLGLIGIETGLDWIGIVSGGIGDLRGWGLGLDNY